ncbi:MAG: hypothetical protein ACRCSP_09285 [Rhodoglobus sp.]
MSMNTGVRLGRSRRLRERPDSLETSSVKLIGFTPLLSFAMIMASVFIYGGSKTWGIIFASTASGNLATFSLAMTDRKLLLQQWKVLGPAAWWNLVSPAIYLVQRSQETQLYESYSLRCLWRWIASIVITMFALVQLQLWGGGLLKLMELR